MGITFITRFVSALACLAVATMPMFGAATIALINNDAAGVGLNDPTGATPVGGNTGTTLGQQRLNALQAAFNIWGATLTSSVLIQVRVNFNALTCTASAAVLGSAGATSVAKDFVGAPVPGVFYPQALANKLSGVDQDPANPDIGMVVNVNLGQANCLTGTFFYLGLDNNHGANVDMVVWALHELAHGLGFNTTTNASTGAFFSGSPSAYDRFLFDTTVNKAWDQMTAPERVASAINTRKLVWTGANVTGAVASVLNTGTPQLAISAPAIVAGTYLVGTAGFGAALSATAVTGDLMPISTDGCAPLTGANVLAVNGNIAIIDRSASCAVAVKVKNAQVAGAKGVVIVNNAAGSPPPGMSGSDPTITIPSVQITQADGVTLYNQLRFRSRSKSGVVASLQLNTALFQGADAANRMRMFTPSPLQLGSSVNHFDASAFPNLLMEPSINSDLTHSVLPPFDLTFRLLQDLGW